MRSKIKSIEDISKIVFELKSKGKKIIHCHGVFDLLHIGHIKHFEEAKMLGDILIVTVTADNFVNKGPNRPAFTSSLRMEAISSLGVIDYVVENEWPEATNAIKAIKPDIYCKGPDYKNLSSDITGKINEEKKAVLSIGGKIFFTKDITFSSSSLLNKYGDIYSKPQKAFINKMVSIQKFDNIEKIFEKFKNLNVLVIGETIVDQYVFCEALGKSGKEPVLVLRDIEMNQYSGGAAAIARHLSDFCGSVSLLSMLGEEGEHEDFIRSSLPKNVKPSFIYKEKSPTIVKKRFVDYISKSKSLGVYSLNDSQLNKSNQNDLNNFFEKLLPHHDLVIVSDYGHGFISSDAAELISKESNFTSLNAQVNAANIGYHTMNNYNDVNCAIINETELRHELRDKDNKVEPLMEKLAKSLKVQNLVVTQGSGGATLFSSEDSSYYHCPAFASKVIDKIGSGDAMLALLSCSLRVGLDLDLSLFIGSLAAAQSVETIGNSAPVNKMQLLKTFSHAIKQ